MQAQPTVSQPYADEGSSLTVRVKTAGGLGMSLIVIGSLSIATGVIAIVLLNHRKGKVGIAIWGGIWIVIGGIIGRCSAANASSACLNWTNMAFGIVSTCIICVDFVIYCTAVVQLESDNYKCNSSPYYTNCNNTSKFPGVAIYSFLLVLTIAEFPIALAVVICCCKYGCSGCCYGETRAKAVQQPLMAQTSVVVQSSAQTSYQGGSPAASYPVTSYPAASYPAASYPEALYPAASYPTASYPTASYPAAPYPTASYPTASYPAAPYPTASYPTASYPEASYPAASYPEASYPTASYPAASYPHASGSTAPPAYTGQQQGAYTSTGNAASAQPVAMKYDPNAPQEKQGAPPPYQ